MVLEQNGLKAVVINLDWICIEEYVVDRIREGINKSTGIPKNNITVCTTHSHSVPNTLNFWGWGDTEDEYINSVIPEIVRSAEIADSKLQEVSVGIAETESLVGVNRRGTTVEGNVCF
jgi:predicted neutral ceramidase superfamily lipid hydrolase